MQEIVINRRHGGFSLSEEAITRYAELKSITLYVNDYNKNIFYLDKHKKEIFCYYSIARDDPALIQTVKELGSKANGWLSDLKIVNVPDGIEWHISDYDGMEVVSENHQTWY